MGNNKGVPETHFSARSLAAGSSVIRELLKQAGLPGMISLAGGLPAAEMFPLERLGVAANSVLANQGSNSLQYSTSDGVSELRDWLAAQPEVAIRAGRSVAVVTGSQQALDLLGRVLVDPGDLIVVEDPCYLGALQAFRGAQPEIESVPVDSDGIQVEVLAEKLAQGIRPRFCYVNPNFQNPSGSVLSSERRIRLAQLADEYGFFIIEDDPYGELYFNSPPLAPIATYSDRVLRISTVSKILAPGLRVGWISGPTGIIDALVIAKQAADLHTGTFDQYLALDLMSDEKWMSNHKAEIRGFYKLRADALVKSLRENLSSHLSFDDPSGGMFIWIRLTQDTDTAELLERALKRGVCFVPGSAFAMGNSWDSHLRLSYVTSSPEDLDQAVQRLALEIA